MLQPTAPVDHVSDPHSTGVPAIIPEKTLAFKFTAEFEGCEAGHYVVQWRVKLLEILSILSGLRLSVNVSYAAEPTNTTGSLDVIMSSESLQDAVKGEYDLILEELVVIQPHEGQARVELALFNNDSIKRCENSGLQVDFVQLRPIASKRPSDVREYVLGRPAKSTFNIHAMESLAYALDTPLYTLPTLSLTRLAWSKDSWFLAALALSKDTAYIIVWDMSRIKGSSSPSANMSALHQNCAIANVKHQGIDELSIGLAISAKGDQVVVYQEPKVGQWKEGSKLDKCELQLRLFYNPLVPQKQVVLDISQQSGNSVNHHGPASDRTATANCQSQSGNASGKLRLVGRPHRMFDTFIGYSSFLTRRSSDEWVKRPKASRPGPLGVEDCSTDDDEEEEKSDNSNNSSNNNSAGNRTGSTIGPFFAACNGIYIDIFEISLVRKWTHIYAIQLTDLVPTLNWRSTCLMMMETMTSDTFMWLEDDGCCSIWDLASGSNITYISCKKNSTFYDTNIREAVRMAISFDGSIVASADSDGTLTTYYTQTGIEIDNRRFLGHKVEYVGFHGKSSQLFVVIRDTATLKLSSKTLDPLLLKSDTTARTVPVPIIGTTIFAFSDTKGFNNRGIVCEVDGSRIRCYISHEPDISEAAADVSNRAELYHVRTRTHQELFDGDSMYWIFSVEVFEESPTQTAEKIIFSFVPEPWTRISTGTVPHPENLQSAYVLSCKSRFVVAGIQTLQIWDLPKGDNNSCSLAFIWSQPIPRGDAAFIPPGTGSGCVEDYYYKIQKSTIYLDRNSGDVVADVKLKHGTDTIRVHIPRSDCSNNLVYRHCLRSIHLLAAAYAFCAKEIKRASKDSVQWKFSFEDHIEALIRFTCDHVNRTLSVRRQNHIGKQATTLLMLLVSRPDLKDSNYVFIEGLLNTTLGEWVPHPSKALNPIAYATSTKDEQLLDILTAYCIKCAKAYHPAYLAPVDQCLNELLDRFPDMLADIFRKTSYIPAQEQTFPLSRVQVANFTYYDGYLHVFSFITLTIGIIIMIMDMYHILYTLMAWIILILIHFAITRGLPRLFAQQRRRYVVYIVSITGIVSIVGIFLSYRLVVMVWVPLILIHPVTDRVLRRLFVQRRSKSADYLVTLLAAIAFITVASFDRFIFLVWIPFILSRPAVIQQMWYSTARQQSLGTNYYYGRRVFTMRSQLPFLSSSRKMSFVNRILLLGMRVSEFPSMQITRRINVGSREICVSPFQLQPVHRDSTHESVFSKISGTNFLESPAVVTSLQLKWYTFGFRYWLGRFIVVLVYLVLVMVVTAQNIRASLRASSSLRNGGSPTWNENDRPGFWVYLCVYLTGFLLLFYELMQCIHRPLKYFSSPYNFIRLTAFVLFFYGCILDTTVTVDPLKQRDDYPGPKELPFMSFTILLNYMAMLLELRAIRPLGIAVNIIFSMARRIGWYFVIFFFILVAFTHSFLYTLHNRRYKPCEGEACENTDNPSSYPTDFGRALLATIFFLSGRYDPVDKSFTWGSVEFQVLMVIYYFFTAFLFFNLLIALMNDVFQASEKEGELSHYKHLSEVIAEMEVMLTAKESAFSALNFRNSRFAHNYSRLVYYHTTEEEVEKYWSKYSDSDISNLSAENRFVVETSSANHHTIMNDIKALAEQVSSEQKEMAELKLLVASILGKLDDMNARLNKEQT